MKRILLTAIVLIATVAAFADGFGIKNGPYIQNVTEEGAEIFFTTSQRAAAWVEVYADGWEALLEYAPSIIMLLMLLTHNRGVIYN